MKLRLWVSTDQGQDMDLFVAVEKLNVDGTRVPFFAKMGYNKGPVALGWQRVSMRKLDEARSTPLQPVLGMEEEAPLRPDEIVPVDIEILPSSTLFRAGETLQLVIQGRDHFDHPSLGHVLSVNQGNHSIHMGPGHESRLLVPIIKQ